MPSVPPAPLRFTGVWRLWREGDRERAALADVNFALERGTLTALVGPSGSGKSTLLHLAGAIDLPSRGSVEVDGRSTSALSEDERTFLRRRTVGFVFQFFHLLPSLTLEENVALPRLIAGKRLRAVLPQVHALLESVGLADRRGQRPGQLSGGEMQRAAVARALVVDPDIVLADEPTGNLDSIRGREVLELLRGLAQDGQRPRTVLMATHDPAAAALADRVIHLADGRVVG